MTTLLIANNATTENGQFTGDQLCYMKTAYLFVQSQPDVTHVIMSMSPSNSLHFVWTKFLSDPKGDGSIPPVEVIYDTLDPGDNPARWLMWDKWKEERCIEGRYFQHYRELYLRIHGQHRQAALCGYERGLGRRNIYEYLIAGQENVPNEMPTNQWFDDTLMYHPPHKPEYDVYISPHAKTQGNYIFTFEYWEEVVHRLIEAGVSVTVGHLNRFCEDLTGHPLYRRFHGTHEEWMYEICRHKLVSCGNTGTGWLAAACGVPMITMEPPGSVMADHRYRECGLRNIVEVISEPNAEYCARRIIEEVQHKIVMTTGCYDIIHAGHVRHLEKSRALGSKLIVALNSDESVRSLKGESRPINQQNQRKSVLEALRCVDEVRIFDGANACELIHEIKPQVLTAGFGYNTDQIIGREFVESYGGKVVVTCEGDAKDEPSTTKIAKKMQEPSKRRPHSADLFDICRLAMAYSVNPFAKLKLLAEQYLSVAELPGDIADLGTCRGGTALLLRRLAPEKELYCIDTWTGNPYDEEGCHHGKGEWAASLEDCKKVVGNAHYLKGVFPNQFSPDDTNGILIVDFSFVYVDMDCYQSTIDAIDFFWDRIAPGGKIVFDDYGWHACPGVKIAVDRAFSQSQLQVFTELHTCVITKR